MMDWAELSEEDYEVIAQITLRAMRFPNLSQADHVNLSMDIAAAHLDVGLDLQRLKDADDFNFLHDVVGIANHINRETGKLMGGFLPRHIKREEQ